MEGVNRIGINVGGREKVDGGRKLWNKGRGWKGQMGKARGR